MLNKIKQFVVLLLVLATIVFALQNTTSVSLKLFTWQIEGSLSLLLLISFLIGVTVSYFILSMKNTWKKNDPKENS